MGSKEEGAFLSAVAADGQGILTSGAKEAFRVRVGEVYTALLAIAQDPAAPGDKGLRQRDGR